MQTKHITIVNECCIERINTQLNIVRSKVEAGAVALPNVEPISINLVRVAANSLGCS